MIVHSGDQITPLFVSKFPNDAIGHRKAGEQAASRQIAVGEALLRSLVHDSGTGKPPVGFIALAGFLEDVGSLFQGIAGGASVSVVVFLELVRAPSDGDGIGVLFVVLGIGKGTRAGGVRDPGQLVEVVVGVLDAGRGVAVGDGVVDPLFQVVAPGGDDAAGIGQGGFQVQGIVGGVFMRSVRVGFLDQ